MKKIILIFLLLGALQSYCKNIDSIISDIVKVNIVQHEYIGMVGRPSENYSNYRSLCLYADTNKLVELLNHENNVVVCYASWGLIQKKYSQLPSIFRMFLDSDKIVKRQSGCILSEDSMSSIFYHRFWNSISNKANDGDLIEMDNMILSETNPYWLLLGRALENRVYSKSQCMRIADLAFGKDYDVAANYLSNWYKADYKDELKSYYLNKLDDDETISDLSIYYSTVKNLLSFNDPLIREKVIKRLEENQEWNTLFSAEQMNGLLMEYHIYLSNLD